MGNQKIPELLLFVFVFRNSQTDFYLILSLNFNKHVLFCIKCNGKLHKKHGMIGTAPINNCIVTLHDSEIKGV